MNFIFNWLIGKAKDYFLTNWKTTLAGILGAVLVKFLPGMDEATRTSLIAAVLAAIGTFAKDGDKSGTTAQPRTNPEIVAEQNAMAAPAAVGTDAG